MKIPHNIIATGDDLGLNPSVNKAILYCFEHGYINSTSFLTSTEYFDETVELIHSNKTISNIGVHVNFASGRPITQFTQRDFLDNEGNWDLKKTNRKVYFLSADAKATFMKEIYAQIDKAVAANIGVLHIDSHYHLHTLPCFWRLFLQAAQRYKLKIRLAQTYYEGNYIKYLYRKRINDVFKSEGSQYSNYFESVNHFLKSHEAGVVNSLTEVMLHPDFDENGKLIDHFDQNSLPDWVNYLENLKLSGL
ncbi:putative glycoside hydrolase/deacetylase ChbG (UPF0249 family) [Mucilaginibacter yixingensis]|uniref:Putative glycoside hydrolase/deacetylase ChbG (UPF0249 family) n=1 Tax=Mucilaginibacter yixingensis TaxID=1295612 RepID=A0A2T5JCD1_9SPHI|nr:ChbG/HpnK family deacetylase [Mucilaginibacter yixingensis]PTQ99325.1 putative glycoside hydrolase/deacetylase ChbG (UPF0249 family) [Mucilaginibacter yixingensis]